MSEPLEVLSSEPFEEGPLAAAWRIIPDLEEASYQAHIIRFGSDKGSEVERFKKIKETLEKVLRDLEKQGY